MDGLRDNMFSVKEGERKARLSFGRGKGIVAAAAYTLYMRSDRCYNLFPSPLFSPLRLHPFPRIGLEYGLRVRQSEWGPPLRD